MSDGFGFKEFGTPYKIERKVSLEKKKSRLMHFNVLIFFIKPENFYVVAVLHVNSNSTILIFLGLIWVDKIPSAQLELHPAKQLPANRPTTLQVRMGVVTYRQ